jgi:hypothetical protein
MSIRKEYRETATGDLYIIRYEQDADTWRAFAEHHPRNAYTDRPSECHLLRGDEICVDRDVFNPESLSEITAVAALWMTGFSQFVRTGEFPATGGRVDV